MSRFGVFLLNIAVAFYLFVNGIVGFINASASDFSPIVSTVFKGWYYNYVLIIVLSVCAIIAGILLITAIFKDDLLLTNVILFIFIVLWSIFIIIVDIINPLSSRTVVFLDYLQKLSTHLMILGALILSIKRLRRI
jgi:hypothetical protein